MYDDLNTEERIQAHGENWDVYHVWDLDKTRWTRNVLPVVFGPQASALHALNHVVASAKLNQALHIKALRLVTHYKAP